jgi:hypothetical protein
VLRTGALFHHDVAAPLSALRVAPPGAPRLACAAARAHELPRFEERPFTASPPEEAPATDVIADAAVRQEVAAARRHRDRENAVVGEGSAVQGPDGRAMGRLQQLAFDAGTGQLSSLAVRTGHGVADEVELPADLIAVVDDHLIQLTVDANWVAGWRRVGAGQAVRSRDGALLGTITRRLTNGVEVTLADETGWLLAPLAIVAWFEANQVVLRVTAAQARAWAHGSSARPVARPGDTPPRGN